MASPRYCDNPLPHEGHEWVDNENFVVINGHEHRSYFHCWGVLPSGTLDRIQADVERAEEELARRRAVLADWSERYCRRTERQFYEGDDAPREYDDAEG